LTSEWGVNPLTFLDSTCVGSCLSRAVLFPISPLAQVIKTATDSGGMNQYRFFDQFQDTVLIIDVSGKVLYGNQAASLLLDTSTKRLSSGRELLKLIELKPNPVGTPETLKSLVDQTQWAEVDFTLPDGKTGFVQVSVQPLPASLYENTGEKSGLYLVIMRDSTLERTLHSKYKTELDHRGRMITELEDARKKLQDYSIGLEEKVKERTEEISNINRLLKTILDSLGQGLLVFGRDGICLSIHSQMCRQLLGSEPGGRKIEDVLGFDATDSAKFTDWRSVAFEELIDFDDLKNLAPSTLKKNEKLSVALEYYPLRGLNGALQGIVLAATDRTREVWAMRRAAEERRFVDKIIQFTRHRTAFNMFVREARRVLRTLETPEPLSREQILRDLHTIKGASASFSLSLLATETQALENQLAELKKLNATDGKFLSTIATGAKELTKKLELDIEELAPLFGQIGSNSDTEMLEVAQSSLMRWSQSLVGVTEMKIDSKIALKIANEIGQDIVSETLEKPLKGFVEHLGPSLTELAESQGKKLFEFRIEGGEMRVPTRLFQPLLTSLIHAFRNSIYHGIEFPKDRVAKGKTSEATLVVRFTIDTELDTRRWLKIEIADDGQGVDIERVRAKLRSTGHEALANGTDDEITQSILIDGLSTNVAADAVAGRGVGTSAILAEAKRLGGDVIIKSTPGKGLSFFIMVPLPESRLALPVVVKKVG
jgi:two-component system chemotaxis sensor kinase CheA